MLNLNQLRKIDPTTSNLTDEELEKVSQSFYDMGQLIFEDWMSEKVGSKYPIGSLTESVNENKL